MRQVPISPFKILLGHERDEITEPFEPLLISRIEPNGNPERFLLLASLPQEGENGRPNFSRTNFGHLIN